MFRMTSTIAFLATSSVVTAATLHVPAHYNTIQDAIDAASSGDEVVVAPGVYTEAFAFKEPHITVRSSDGAESTVIDGSQSQAYALAFFNTGTSGTLQGLTLRHFEHPFTGAVTVKDATASIIDCIFEDNRNYFSGSALRIELWSLGNAGQAEVRGCTFRRNETSESGGAMSALLLDGESLLVSNCVFEENTSEQGGHLAINANGTDGSVTIDSCAFRDGHGDVPRVSLINQSIGSEGERDVTFINCEFDENDGPMLQVDGEVSLILSDSTFAGTSNPTVQLFPPSHAEISNCTFCGMTVPVSGAWTDLGGNSFEDQCSCPGDGNGDGEVDVHDLLSIIAAFGEADSAWDFDDDGIVNVNDMLILIGSWGGC
ncbi:MAG: hypothetical protein QF733_09960 [Phycisphaerales bacterium]|nr:hypothetical protein [Phycisphaerales bacterium]